MGSRSKRFTDSIALKLNHWCPVTNDDTKLFYDLTAERTEDAWYANDVLLPTIQDFLALLPDEPRVLDLGCGPGYESMRLHAAGADVVGVDFSSESVRIARERCPQCSFFELDFQRLDDRWGTFDGVFASGSLIHIGPEDMPKLLDTIARVLEEDGKLLAIILDGEGMRKSQPKVNGRTLPRVIHLYSRHTMEWLATSSSFHLVREGYLAPELIDEGWRCYVLAKPYPVDERHLDPCRTSYRTSPWVSRLPASSSCARRARWGFD